MSFPTSHFKLCFQSKILCWSIFTANLSNKAELTADFWETFASVTDSPFEESSLDDALLAKVRQFRPRDISCIPLPGEFSFLLNQGINLKLKVLFC